MPRRASLVNLALAPAAALLPAALALAGAGRAGGGGELLVLAASRNEAAALVRAHGGTVLAGPAPPLGLRAAGPPDLAAALRRAGILVLRVPPSSDSLCGARR